MATILSWFASWWELNLLLVFLLNLSSTCLGTLRTILLSKKIVKPVYVTTFIDSIIFVYTVTLVAKASTFAYVLAFAGGRVLGIYVGNLIESKLAIGTIAVVVYKHINSGQLLAERLRYCGFSVSMQIGFGIDGQETLILTIVTDRKHWPLLNRIIRESDNTINMYVKSLDTAKGTIVKQRQTYKVKPRYKDPHEVIIDEESDSIETTAKIIKSEAFNSLSNSDYPEA